MHDSVIHLVPKDPQLLLGLNDRRQVSACGLDDVFAPIGYQPGSVCERCKQMLDVGECSFCCCRIRAGDTFVKYADGELACAVCSHDDARPDARFEPDEVDLAFELGDDIPGDR
ncbi:MAG: hypothetical protein B7733_00165 [Myxococcales bacterium FL481]|nr:MAG: hypothetical protein B7733_00165 [Myxococcales bacterium FL481]